MTRHSVSMVSDVDNVVLGAYHDGSLKTCFRACLLTSCQSMYVDELGGTCVIYKDEYPIKLLPEPQWSFYSPAM